MSEQKRIDKILEAVEKRVQDEIGGLLGTDFELIGNDSELQWKETTFSQLKGKQICALMDVVGDINGNGCLLVGIKDAIRLGGTLIMLPEGELDEVIGREEYSEEVEDSFGEIANIIAGSFTKDFEEMHPKACRFIRKEQEVIAPSKVDIDSADPVDNQIYYVVSYQMILAGKQMGNLVMLMPAEPFGFELDGVIGEAQADEVQSSEATDESATANPETESSSDASETPKFNAEKNKERVDQLLEDCQKGLEEEIGGLLGVEISLLDIENQFVSKEEFFKNHINGPQVFADMDVVGDIEGKSYFVSTIKDAIHLGGVLIMLPPAELENVVAEGDFGEDAKDAYGELANIASGVYTRIFEERYTKKLRFIKKNLTEVAPTTVEVESDQPIENCQYYSSSFALVVDGKPLSKLHMLFPLEILQLHTFAESQEEVKKAAEGPVEVQKQPPGQADATDPNNAAAVTFDKEAKAKAEKHKGRVDGLLSTCLDKIAEEVGSLLGVDVNLKDAGVSPITKEEFFHERVSSKQVIADMDVVGELEGKGYLSVDLKDAVRIGGVLIMLPASELESVVASEEFGEDAADAYGEIANIIAGVYTAVFEEQYTKKIRFIRTDLHQVAPATVDISSDEPMPDQHYYLHSLHLELNRAQLGELNFLIPLDILDLEALVQNEQPVVDTPEADQTVASDQSSQQSAGGLDRRTVGGSDAIPDILLVGDDEQEASKIADVLFERGYNARVLSFKDDLQNYLPGEVKAVYLVMKDVNEQAFGTAIKVSSVCSLPIIAAGPEWTRTKVLKAVKYGVADILLTPATEGDIEENANNNLLKLAA